MHEGDLSVDDTGDQEGQIEDALSDRSAVESHLTQLVGELGSAAGQGVYVTLANGDIAGLAVPKGLRADLRNERKNFADRPYFFCVPLGDQQSFGGLLFAACQPGAWEPPVTWRDKLAPRDIEFVLVDSNGIAIVPSLAALQAERAKSPPGDEEPGKNMGFPFTSLRDYSQRDRHVAHITENIVPVGIDDDIHEVSADLHLFSMVASVRHTRWKMALSRYVPSRPKG